MYFTSSPNSPEMLRFIAGENYIMMLQFSDRLFALSEGHPLLGGADKIIIKD